MNEMKYFLAILFIQNTFCTIDVGVKEYEYLAQQLTPEECRVLYVSLHFPYYQLPTTLNKAVARLPKGMPCFKMLLRWDRSKHKLGGRGKSHEILERRLRQLGKNDLAMWLDDQVFYGLSKNVNSALETYITNTSTVNDIKYKDTKLVKQLWTSYDSILWVTTGALFSTAVFIFIRVMYVCIKIRYMNRKAKQDELMDLLKYGSGDSDQETIYECAVNKSTCRDAADNDDG